MKESTNNIELIDKNQLESRLYNSNIHIKKEIDDHYYEGIKAEHDDDEINNEEVFITEVDVKYERDVIKRECFDVTVEYNTDEEIKDNKDGVKSQNNNFSTKFEVIQRKRNHSEATLRYQNDALSDCKEVRIVDVMLNDRQHIHYSGRQYTDIDQWTSETALCLPPIVNDKIEEDNSNKKIYKCCHCDFKSHRKRRLRAHVNTEHAKNIPFNCSRCTFTTYDKWILTRHINAKHTKTTVYNCTYCDYKTYLKHSLSAHINTKHTKANFYNCSYCSFKTHLKHSLNLHVNVKHTKRNIFNCSYCSFTTCRKYSLSTHINNKHTKNVLFNCTLCSYKAYDKVNLKRHVNAIHTKSTVFSCSLCSHQVYNKSALNKHVKAKHS